MDAPRGRGRAYHLIFFGVFLASLLLPLRNGLPTPRDALPPPSQSLASNPLLAAARSAVYLPPEYEKRYDQHYAGRQARIQLYNDVLLNVLGVRAFSTVLRGKDGWLLYTDEGNLDDYQNAHPFSPADLEEIGGKLRAVQQEMEGRGITFFVVVAPNKETIYPELVPDGIQKIGSQSRLDQLIAYLSASGSPVKLLDLRPALLAAKAEYQLYYRTDSHWNDYGAYFASAEILKAVQKDFPQVWVPAISDYRLETGQVSGDLARMLPVEPLLSETAVWLHPDPGPQARFLEKTDRVVTVSQVSSPDLPAAVIFRDSFANQLEPFLSESFSRAVYPWSFTIDRDLVDREAPDVVIYEIAERYLHLLKDINGR